MGIWNTVQKWQGKSVPPCSMIVAAAGSSCRMGGQDKLFAPLAGVPVLTRTLRAIDRAELVSEIVVAAQEERMEAVAALCAAAALHKKVKVVKGGASRTESVLAAALVLLTACSSRGTEPPVRIGEAIGEASLLRSYSAAEAFQEADAVALVRVGDWLGEQDGGFPITFYKAAVVKSYKGDLPREFTLMQNGGSAGTYEDYPLYTCGNELLVFLRKADADYPDAYQSVGSFSTVLYAADAVDGTRYYLDRFGLMSMREQETGDSALEQPLSRMPEDTVKELRADLEKTDALLAESLSSGERKNSSFEAYVYTQDALETLFASLNQG